MSNVKRLLQSNRIFFVTANLRLEQRNFSELEFPVPIDAMGSSRGKLGFRLYGYVLMPDHWHALIGVTEPLTISRAVQDIKWLAARSINKLRRRSGALWQHQFWDRFVRHGKEFGERLNYMHMNPVRKGMVAAPADWRWSSFNNFAMDKAAVDQCPIQIDYSDW